MIFCFHKYLFRFLKMEIKKERKGGGKKGSKKERANFEMSDNFLMFKKFAKKYTKAEKKIIFLFLNLDKEL